MNKQYSMYRAPDDDFGEKELMEILNSMDDDLIDRRIEKLLAEEGEFINIDSIKKKAFGKLEREKSKKRILKRIIVLAAATAVTISTVYAKDIRKAFELFIGKSVVYQTVVDGEAYYLPTELPLGDKYMLTFANMSEGTLFMRIKASSVSISDAWHESIDIYVTETDGVEKHIDGGYSIKNDELDVYFYKLPMLREFKLSLGGEIFSITLEKAESLEVDEKLIMGEPRTVDSGDSHLIANVAANRTDEGTGVGITLVVGFGDSDLRLSRFYGPGWNDNEIEFHKMFMNRDESIFASSNSPISNPLKAIDADGKEYELRKPQNAIGQPVTVFETDAAHGTQLTVEIPAIEAHYEKIVDNITLTIPDEGEAIIDAEIDFIIQKALLKSVRRTSDTNAEVIFELNTGEDKSVQILDISAYSKDVEQGESKVSGSEGVLALTFGAETKEVELEFSWPHFIIEGNWKISL